jgi:hypothetical protein
MNPDNYPYKMTPYYIKFYAQAYYKTNHTYVGDNITMEPVQIRIDAPMQTAYTTHFVFRDSIPSMLEKGKRVVDEGLSFNMSVIGFHLNTTWDGHLDDEQTYYTYIPSATYTIWAVVTDNDNPRNVYGYALFNVSTQTSETYTLMGKTYNYGILDTVIHFGDQFFSYNKTYNIYYGVELGQAGLTSSNTFIDIPDNTVSPSYFSLSGTWSGHPVSGTELKEDNSQVHKFVGVHIFVDTTPITPIHLSFTAGTLGDWVRTYGDYIGLPWFYLLIAFLIIGIMCAIPLSFSLRFDVELPNIVYGICIIAGSAINLGLNLFDLWMCVFFILVIVFIFVIRFQEQVKSFLSLPSDYKPKSKISKKIPKVIEKMFKTKDEGVKAYIEPRKNISRAGRPIKGAGVYEPFEHITSRGEISEKDWLTVGHPNPVYSETGKRVYHFKKRESED